MGFILSAKARARAVRGLCGLPTPRFIRTKGFVLGAIMGGTMERRLDNENICILET